MRKIAYVSMSFDYVICVQNDVESSSGKVYVCVCLFRPASVLNTFSRTVKATKTKHIQSVDFLLEIQDSSSK